ncbi:MAG TPA: hypoxanthine phosphoribosyltransferase [Verrucomicrobia bacterium]|nr:hypoxanthine phosphoribosyltransferase [Verrucomicrobiota bacterium]HCG20081.1 hypoxanthine phosphoribosyltransferase [Verrucomicrobiota bacterium]
MVDVAKHYLSANEFLRDSWRLAAAVKQSGWKPDLLIALWRGGAAVGVSIHEYFRAVGWNVQHIPLKCASYTGIGENKGEVVFTLGEEIFAMMRKGDRVLVVDDVFDTGKTALAVKNRIAETGADMRMACVYWKPRKNVTNITPDYFVKDVGNDWIVFPHEIEGLTTEEIQAKDPFLASLINA